MQVIYKPIDELIPYVNNARIHSDKQIDQIAASIKEFGFNNPILLDGDNGLIAGHGRLLAAKKLKLTEVPCIELAHLSDTQKKAYILADNKLALNSEWDEELLKLELDELKASDFDLDLTGFDDLENLISESDTNRTTDGTQSTRQDKYTQTVDVPQYQITGDKPNLDDLYDDTKTNELIENIEASGAPDDVKKFLIKAAHRHTSFSYKDIAEYYAHAPIEVQELMEQSALVIIDFNDAIKNGFVKLNTYIREKYNVE